MDSSIIVGTDKQMMALIGIDILCFSSYLLPISFLPQFALSYKISHITIGIILAFFPIGAIITSIFLAKMMSVIGKVKILMNLVYVYAFSIALFGFVFWLDNWLLIVIVSSLARILQGSAVGGLSTIVYSYVPRLFRHKQNKVISYLEMSVGLSMAFGQTLGSILNFIFGKPQIVMLLLSLIYYLTMQYFCKQLPDDLEKPKKTISYKPFATNFQYIVVFLLSSLTVGLQTFIFTGTSYDLVNYKDQFDYLLNEGSVLASYTVFYGLVCFYMTTDYPQTFSNKFLISGGFILMIIGLIFIPCQKLFGLPHNIYLAEIGLIIAAIGNGPSLIQSMPELMVFGRQCAIEGTLQQVDDMNSGIFITSLSFGEFIGPILVSVLFQKFNYEFACQFIQIITIIVLFLYMYFCIEDKSKRYQGENQDDTNQELSAAHFIKLH